MSRIHACNAAPVAPDRRYVLYWMVGARRLRWNFALQHALDEARRLDRPLLVFEALRCDYRWASDRLHRFVLDGMAEHARALADSDIGYLPYVEPERGAATGLLEALAADACLVVTDEVPGFFLPRMVASASQRIDVRLQAVDGVGLLPLRAADRIWPTAYAFRRHLHRSLPEHLERRPLAEPLAEAAPPAFDGLPASVLERWPAVSADDLGPGLDALLARLPIDHAVPVVPERGGEQAAGEALARFLDERLPRYATERNQPELEVSSGLSPWLHFGHISVHEVFDALARREDWTPARLAGTTKGQRQGWWGMGENAEAFLDELVTWRELCQSQAFFDARYAEYSSLPDWARATLEEHAGDPREHLYDLDELERGATHDALWNAAQTQLVSTGRMHNYLRMLWGKKILEWSPSPQEAMTRMIALNDRWALDGRDANSYGGIGWVLGRYDRPWGPERPVFGKIRYMTSANTARKVRVKDYIQRYDPCSLFAGR